MLRTRDVVAVLLMMLVVALLLTVSGLGMLADLTSGPFPLPHSGAPRL